MPCPLWDLWYLWFLLRLHQRGDAPFVCSLIFAWDLPTMALQPAVGFGLKPWLLKLWTNAKTRRFGKGRVGCIWILGPCLPPSYLAQNHTSLMESIYINPYRLPDEEVEAKSDPQIILGIARCQGSKEFAWFPFIHRGWFESISSYLAAL